MTSVRVPRRAVLGGIAGASWLALAGCADSPSPDADAESGPESDTAPDADAAAGDRGRLRLATGSAGAVFREFGAALADIVNREWDGGALEVLHTDASYQNLHMLAAGDCELALANIDGEAEGPDDLRALGRVFESVLHVVVPEDSPVASFADLAGRVVTCGLPESGTQFTAGVVFDATGVRPEIVHHTQTDAIEALAMGEVEAMLSLTGMPTPAVQKLAARGGFRLLSIPDAVADVVRAHPDHYLPVTIPRTAYDGMDAAETVGVPSLLVCRAGLPDDLARTLTRIVFTHGEELSAVRPEAGQINMRTGIATHPIALHDGSRAWFRAEKP